MEKKICYTRAIAFFWFCIMTWYITELCLMRFSMALIVDFFSYFLLGVQLLIINVILLRLMNGFIVKTNTNVL